jgi:hypothetical protein
MGQLEDEIWEAAELMMEWKSDIGYKLLFVPREAIDEGSEEADAYLLIGIDDSGIRRVDVLMDIAYGREIGLDDQDELEKSLEGAQSEAKKIIRRMIKK